MAAETKDAPKPALNITKRKPGESRAELADRLRKERGPRKPKK